ncbi:putative PurR-regulated permease PerM [Aliiruegeria haliotis]|uniref:Putative PurR-regulated permease PerM n=1 Tax=Aliiruegeria haliotis TaxID=1280846 RepID=A0A2T0RF69_9RHOB|nr:AI-2E family transporter [Aliiruegeria haliotis]PRY19771.1 putative PurR-regulated permease PerM [Aliiruegeria haliotis]
MSDSDPTGMSVASSPSWFLILMSAPVVVGFLWFGRDFLIPLAVTGLIFILSSAIVDRICSLRVFGRSPPRWLANILAGFIVIFAFLFLGTAVSGTADELVEAMPRYEERLADIHAQLNSVFGGRLAEGLGSVVERLDLGNLVAAILGQLGGGVSMVVLIVLYLAFLISERAAWVAKLPRFSATAEGAVRTKRVMNRIAEGVKGYMWVNAVTSAMSGTVAYLIFRWVGLDFAELLAVIVFVVGFIPNIGAFIGVFLPASLALLQFDSFTPFLIVLLGYGGADQFISNLITPAMQGKSLNLSTFMVMVSLTFWGTLWGGIGAFLSTPMMVVALVVCAEIPSMRWMAVLLSSDGDLGFLESGAPDDEHASPYPP